MRSDKEVLEYNKRCAEFLNFRKHSDYMYEATDEKFFVVTSMEKGDVTSYGYVFPIDCLMFHSDWNLIMEVVEAIENIQIKGQYIYSIQLRGATCEIKCSTQYSLAFDFEMPCIYEVAKSKKEAVVQAINKFLIWYKP